MQGYDLDIRHIPGKINPADHLSRQLLKDATQRKGLVTDENLRYVELLRIPRDAIDIEIQDALSKLFARDRETVMETKIETNRQISDLTKAKIPWQWNDRQEQSFQQLKTALATPSVLRLPDFDRQFVVTTDASNVTVGAILEQNFGFGLQPVALPLGSSIMQRYGILHMSGSC